MKKNLLFLLLIMLMAGIGNAQDTLKKWTRSFQTGLNINQASFSTNWKGGGTNSVALGSLLNAKANYNDHKKMTWDNDLQLAYGFVQNQGENLKKTTDKIYFDSKLGYKISKKWNLFASTNFTSQFDAGFKYTKDDLGVESKSLISKFMAPGYLTNSLGFEYKPVDYFWARLGTGTLRQTFVVDTLLYKNDPSVSGNYGVEPGKKLKSEVAFQLIANYDRDILKNTNLKVRLMALAPYEHLTTITARLDASITAKVNKYISVNFAVALLNDYYQDVDVQYSQTFGLGIMYSFSEFK